MTDWEPTLKRYPHFDGPISVATIQKFVRDPAQIATNKFYPFMLSTEGWQPFRTRLSGRPDKKERKLRFASRRDAYIYAYYRHILIQPYEALLAAEGLSDHVIAYRKILKSGGGGMAA